MERFMDDDMLVEHGKDTTQMWVKYEDCVQEIALTKADAQATIAALQEKLTAALKVKADYDRWLSGGVYFTTAEYEKHAEDHRQREAALQARVQELEEWKRIVTGAGTDQESVIRLAATEYTKTAVQCWKEANAKLESQLTQRTAELEALKLVNDTHMKTVMKLSHIVEQQTAELEAIEKILDIDSGKTTVEKVRDLHYSFKQVWESYQDASNEMFKAQAELERVSGELVEATHNANVYQSLYSTGCMDRALLENELRDLRTLVLALPKVEGKIEVCSGVYNFILLKHDSGNRFLCGQIETEQTAKAIAALWQHRQGMEG